MAYLFFALSPRVRSLYFQVGFWGLIQMACGWWYERIARDLSWVLHKWVYEAVIFVLGGKWRISHRLADLISKPFQQAVYWLSCGGLCWYIAESYLRAKFDQETEELNRAYLAQKQAEMRERGL